MVGFRFTKTPWLASNIPDLTDKTALVTGATGGLGFECAKQLALKGATVLLGGRNPEKGKTAVNQILNLCPKAKVTFALIDQASLKSISSFCEEFNSKGNPLDILINNAGVVAIPTKELTEDGFELQFATNYLSHFALTAKLLPSLRQSSSPRVVNVSSTMAHFGGIKFGDLESHKSYYYPWLSYSQTKLAQIFFSYELQRRSDSNGWGILSLPTHPGLTHTGWIDNGPSKTWISKIFFKMLRLYWHGVEMGALPILYAATNPDAKKWGYYGVDGLCELRGNVGDACLPSIAKNKEIAEKLWEDSEKLIGVTWT